MKIKRILRVEYIPSKPGRSFLEKPKDWPGVPELQTEQGSFEPSEPEFYPQFAGMQFTSVEQLRQFLASQVPAERSLYMHTMTSSSDRLREDESIEIPNYNYFVEMISGSDDYLPLAYWFVEYDERAAAKREQVSLTLRSVLLKQLRAEAKATGQSLSGIIDQKLALAVQSQSSSVLREYNTTLESLAGIVAEAKEKLQKIVS